MKSAENKKYGGISDAAVRKATGKGWQDWFAILDKAGATRLAHKDIVEALTKKHPKVDGWGCR